VKILQLIGCGMGLGHLTQEAEAALRQADCILGSPRLLKIFADPKRPQCKAVSRAAVQQVIEETDYACYAVLVSGDTGFYSGASTYCALPNCQITVYPGISSVSALCAKLRTRWDDVRLVSLHGTGCNLVQEIARHRRVFCLTGNNVAQIGRLLCDYGLGQVAVTVAENLWGAEEQIAQCQVVDLADMICAPMTVLLFENAQADAYVPVGIPDDCFVRGEVPMTKQAVRAVAMSQLRLRSDMICWDIGAGTGSVSVEMALQAWQGQVYAVEVNPEGVALIEQNCRRWRAANVQVTAGLAPAALSGLPAPDAVFIGGSKGNLEEIFARVLEENPRARIVATAVTLETIAELQRLFTQWALPHCAVQQLAITEVLPRGAVHMLQAQNPIYLFSGGGEPYGAGDAGSNG